MILYLDTSALVKLFVSEPHSVRVRRAVSSARSVSTHSIAYVEACAAFARLAHDRRRDALFSALRRNLDVQWASWDILNVTEHLIRRAADLAGCHRLRGYDSLHLAAAEALLEIVDGHAPFRFAVFDGQLRDAAKALGIPSLPG